jgi:AcrR family transcriptional regulator
MTAERIVGTATDLVETDGVAGLTMRALASKLGVPVTTIYWHVGNKDAVLDAVVNGIIDRFGGVPARGTDGAARIVSLCRGWRRNLLEQPTLVGLVHSQGRTAELFHPLSRVLVHEFTAAGLVGRDAAMAVRVTLRFVTGAVLTDVQVERAPSQRVTFEGLWAEEDVPSALRGALTRDEDPTVLFDYAIRKLVVSLITGVGE